MSGDSYDDMEVTGDAVVSQHLRAWSSSTARSAGVPFSGRIADSQTAEIQLGKLRKDWSIQGLDEITDAWSGFAGGSRL
jgi:hypothetical protein